jgi:hypothetical protein
MSLPPDRIATLAEIGGWVVFGYVFLVLVALRCRK